MLNEVKVNILETNGKIEILRREIRNYGKERDGNFVAKNYNIQNEIFPDEFNNGIEKGQ